MQRLRRFSQVRCNQFVDSDAECRNELLLHYLEASGQDDTRQRDITKYTTSDVKLSANSFLKNMKDTDVDKMEPYFATISVDENTPGIFIALGDQASCSIIHSVELSGFVCPAVQKGLSFFGETVAGLRDKTVLGTCVKHSSRSSPPRATCRHYADWDFYSGTCKCNEGFEPNDDKSECLRESNFSC